MFCVKSLCPFFLFVSFAHAATEAVMPEPQRVFFKTYCVSCHNADKQKGATRLDDIPFVIADVPTADRWQKVLGALNSG